MKVVSVCLCRLGLLAFGGAHPRPQVACLEEHNSEGRVLFMRNMTLLEIARDWLDKVGMEPCKRA